MFDGGNVQPSYKSVHAYCCIALENCFHFDGFLLACVSELLRRLTRNRLHRSSVHWRNTG